MTDNLPVGCGLFMSESTPPPSPEKELRGGGGGGGEDVAAGVVAEPPDESSVVEDRFSELTIVDQEDAADDDASSESSPSVVEATHVIVLVHGWMGNPSEMDYIRESIRNAAVATKSQSSSSSSSSSWSRVRHRFVVHSAACNCDKTDDGIAVGGSRLAHEINGLVRHVVRGECGREDLEERGGGGSCSRKKFTLSIVGNSLGGLYARHAMAGIDWDIGGTGCGAPPLMLIPMVFVTTATPHLGISQHTYVPLPRAAEFVVAQGMKQTGRDFFRFTQVMEDLFCQDYFLDPLSSFQQRIAYINVYGTDFQVPTATAAFWAPDSDSPHYRVKNPGEGGLVAGESETSSSSSSSDAAGAPIAVEQPSTISVPRAIVMTLTTPRRPEKSKVDADDTAEEKKGEEGDVREEEAADNDDDGGSESAKPDKKPAAAEDVFTRWSKRLDRLGWTKVLVDVREDVPGVRESIAQVIDGHSSDDGSDPKHDDGDDEVDDDESKSNGSGSNGGDPKPEEGTGDEKDEDLFPPEESVLGVEGEPTETAVEDATTDTGGTAADDELHVPDWSTKDAWTAGELLAEFKGGLLTASATRNNRRGSFWDLKPKLPLGHAIMIANAKDAFNKKVTTGGKPVMDYLGASLVRILRESVVPHRSPSELELHEC
eukprot:CAMPEP_0197174930 /NCGR_PEP_ID=MMETSP1423-20130617/1281_1 /TAXON_ID=476441 /ORGANISM="Pseudo-nitzschia heimii, Strain UNC1101" /LENGTH=654 /DNA_ID=CAMNT_0042623951 /DNA_START=70 /DNA_END=2034 /DNA_ORIENTATION=+